MSTPPARILVVGGGYVGLYTALGLERRLGRNEAQLTLVTPENFMLYQPLLPEVASGTLEPRHAVVPLRMALRRTHVLTGKLVSLAHDDRTATVQPHEGDQYDVDYDHLVLGLGSETRALPIPGLADHAVGFQSITEANHLRNQVLSRLDAAEAATEDAVRRRALTFAFVGGGYTGVEALAELQDMARAACRWFPSVRPHDLRWVLVEATDTILPIVERPLADFAAAVLRERGIEIHLETQLESAEGGRMRLSDGEDFEAGTLVWSAGVRPHPLVGELGLASDDQGRVVVDEYLRVRDTPGAWSAGDCAAVPDPSGQGTYPANAQFAEREARHLAANLAAVLRGQDPQPFRFQAVGELITLGRFKGVAQIKGRTLRGIVPWLLRRAYYASRIPTADRKVRVTVDWLVSLAFRRDIVQLGSQQHPRAPLQRAADPDKVA